MVTALPFVLPAGTSLLVRFGLGFGAYRGWLRRLAGRFVCGKFPDNLYIVLTDGACIDECRAYHLEE